MAPQRYDRPFCEYQEMVNHLVHDYGLIIKDNDFAIHALKVFTYYDLVNGYKDSLMINERYRRGITIELLCKLRIFDKDFQNILFSRMIMIENFFKNTLSYIIAKNFGVNHKEYLHLKNYNYAIKHINFLNTLKEIHAVIDSPHTPMPTAHYKNNHNHIPPWILFKNISFSNSINLFRALKAREKDYIVNELLPSQRLDYPKKVEFLTSGLNLLRKCRNQIAHNLKFVTFQGNYLDNLKEISITSLLPMELTKTNDIYKTLGTKDLYAVILFIYAVLPDKNLKDFFLNDLFCYIGDNVEVFEEYACITKLPMDILTRIKATTTV